MSLEAVVDRNGNVVMLASQFHKARKATIFWVIYCAHDSGVPIWMHFLWSNVRLWIVTLNLESPILMQGQSILSIKFYHPTIPS